MPSVKTTESIWEIPEEFVILGTPDRLHCNRNLLCFEGQGLIFGAGTS